jgi:antitoxin (DNA-binding transcriptional repressor) of toxin-antitoxin stability system
MKTITITKARANLSALLERAKGGEDIGIVSGDQIVALRPVTVTSDDYALREYGATQDELERFEKRTEQKILAERRRGKIKRFSGDINKKDLAISR